jgi:hypothetical protein
MKKRLMTLLAATTLLLSSCFGPGMGTQNNTNSTGNILSSVLGSVLGSVLFGGSTFDQSGLLGSWNYNAPGAAFTTQQALTNAPDFITFSFFVLCHMMALLIFRQL